LVKAYRPEISSGLDGTYTIKGCINARSYVGQTVVYQDNLEEIEMFKVKVAKDNVIIYYES